MKPTTIAVVGPRARDIGEQMERHGAFAVTAEAGSFTQLLADASFPTRYVIIEEADDPDCTRARVAIAQSLGVRVVLIAAGDGGVECAADVVIDRTLSVDAVRAIEDAEAETRRLRRQRAQSRPLTPVTPREREAMELWGDLRRIPLVADRMGVGYTTAATLIKRARKKLAQSEPAS